VDGRLRGGATMVWQAARGTARLWETARAPRECAGCRTLGRRCPWCLEELRRLQILLLALLLPEAAWPVMLWSAISFSLRAQVLTALWALLHFRLLLLLTLHI